MSPNAFQGADADNSIESFTLCAPEPLSEKLATDVVAALPAVLIAGLLAYYFSIRLWKKSGGVESKAFLVDEVVRQTKDLEQVCRKYWTSDGAMLSIDECASLEIQIKNETELLVESVEAVCIALEPKGIEFWIEDLRRDAADLFGHATGGDFECDDRKADVVAANKASKCCQSIRLELLRRRISIWE